MRRVLFVLFVLTLTLIVSGCSLMFYGDVNGNWKIREDRADDHSALLASMEAAQMLRIPDLIDVTEDGARYELTVNESDFAFFEGFTTKVKSYSDQGYLGPTIKMRRGSTFYPTITNNLSERTTVHWHGLEVTGENDGAMGSIALVYPGESKTYELAVDQHASTIWYHPHAMGTTATQVYEGLAGMMIIEDEIIENIDLPTDYGVNDIPLVLQAKLFDGQGNLHYGHTGGHGGDIEHAMNAAPSVPGGEMDMEKQKMTYLLFEDRAGPNRITTEGFLIMTNGQYAPYLEVKNELIRFRTLNGSNHGIMDVSLSDGSPLQVIGTDGGLLEAPQEKDFFEVVAGQRFEVIVDLSDKQIGDQVDLIANGQVVLTLRVTEDAPVKGEVPEDLVTITAFEPYDNQQVTHKYILDNDMINNKPFSHTVPNEVFVKDQIYYFEVVNRSFENHSFHIHNSQFLVVEKNGRKVDYKEIGWKDTIYLRPEESMILQVQFRFTGDYMYHCHILMHEENGMMGMFRVVD